MEDLAQWHRDEREWWDRYGDYMTYQWRLTPRLHKIIRAPLEEDYIRYLLKPGGKLLDLGCGSGWLSLYFAEQGMSVLGLDVSREQIVAANDLKNQRGLEQVAFECVDFTNWDERGHEMQFDSVFVSAFLHHLPEVELELVFRKIASVVRTGGRVFMYEPLFACRPSRFGVRVLDRLSLVALALLLDRVPRWLGLISDRHKSELARGYGMTSPHEKPVDVDVLRRLCGQSFDISDVRGWHLHSLGFSMQVTALKEGVRPFYEALGKLWYLVDRIAFRLFGWEAFSAPRRFILCGVKLTRNSRSDA